MINRLPCPSCPYRADVESGIWASAEYEKLPLYDLPTQDQPLNVFFCHQADGCVCRGWLDVHGSQVGANELLSLRLGIAMGKVDCEAIENAIAEGPQTKVFDSGMKAARHGVKDIESPSPGAIQQMEKIKRRRTKA